MIRVGDNVDMIFLEEKIFFGKCGKVIKWNFGFGFCFLYVVVVWNCDVVVLCG